MHRYDNPVISGFHPDPSVCRVGDDYYLVCSSFEYFPGLPLFHSKDLVHWEQIGNVLDRPGQLPLPLPGAKASGGLYAPTIRHHDGRYWVISTNVDGGGNFVVSAERSEGPWSDPVWIDLPGIDPDLAWEEDGTCWCAFSGPEGGIGIARIDPVGGDVLEGPFTTWSGSGLKYPEAPHLYRIGDLDGIELQDREFVAAIREGREPEEFLARVMPCYRTLVELDTQLASQRLP